MILGQILLDEKKARCARQSGKCYVCGKKIYSHEVLQCHLSHRIIKSPRNIKKYGKEIIHHWMNTPLTCGDTCNRKVLIRLGSIKKDELINKIKEDLKNG